MIWRGELAAALLSGDEKSAELVARNLDLVQVEQRIAEPKPVVEPHESGPSPDRIEVETTGDYPDKIEQSYYWQPFRYESRAEIEIPTASDSRWEWGAPPPAPPESIPIAAKRVVHPRLRTGVSSVSPGRGLDLPKMIRSLARAEPLHELPRKRLRRWGRQILVVLDRSDRLVPFFEDQERLCKQLEALTPDGAITQLFATDPDSEFVFVDGVGNLARWTFGAPSRIVVLSDLGVLQRGGDRRLRQRWRRWARTLDDQGFSLVALVPFPVQVAGSDLGRVFTLVPWQRSAHHYVHDESRRSQLADQLLAAASPVVRLEPGLLRMLRSSIPDAMDASLESDVWQHPVVTSRHVDAATLDRDAMEERYRPAFAELPPEQRARFLTAIRGWRFDFSESPEVWFQEILNLDADSQGIVEKLFPGDLKDAISGLHHLAMLAKPQDDARFSLRVREYGGRAADWLSTSAWEDPRIRQPVHDLWDAAPGKRRREKGGLDPKLLGGQGEPVRLSISHRGRDLQFAVNERGASSFVGSLWSRNGWIDVASVAVDRNAFWQSGRPPGWASDWGRDELGAWAEFQIEGADSGQGRPTITQRMRWMPMGTFLMGSPDSEKGRWDDEGPQHEVTLTRGFWMFDTPVTQELWLAVMGENPSDFKGDRRPVENVSWDDAQRFLDRLNEKLGDAVFVLPSEAQWEYSCRAGTTTAYAFGDDPAILDEYAWYDSNSDGSTHEAAEKRPNTWGLFDMHGNVWEWCQDYWAPDYNEARTEDPAGPPEGHHRVLRGGSWINLALYARSAYRHLNVPGHRSVYIGFRCAQVQAGAEPAEEDGEAVEPHAFPTSRGEAAALKIDAQQITQTPIPAGRAVFVRSDVDSLMLRKIPKPEWASAIGRDRYGLWADFSLPAVGSDPPRQDVRLWRRIRRAWRSGSGPDEPQHGVVQRMRWIPPGRFLMGSPDDDDQANDSEKPQHEVTLSAGYWLFDTPVTQELWRAVLKEDPSSFKGSIRPVEQVSWDDCQTFHGKINEIVAGLNLSLPTEAEWEYACRAGKTTRYAFGEEISPDQADYYQGGAETAETSEVGKFAANGWGLFDMHGNVREWCQDWYGPYSGDAQHNPLGPKTGRGRVLRGGGWSFYAQEARSAYRFHNVPGLRSFSVGFRCAQVQPAGRKREQASEEAGHSPEANGK